MKAKDTKVWVLVGTGGVGKTSISAALGLKLACDGKRTLVITVDPARRLANALGLSDVGSDALCVPDELIPADLAAARGKLWMLMPEPRATFDTLVKRSVLGADQIQRILNNRLYQAFTQKVAGALEYAAIQRLYDYANTNDFDAIILDTPPAQNATDFFLAPKRLLDFVSPESLGWFSRPYQTASRLSSRVFRLGSALFGKTVGKLIGSEALQELVDFLADFQGLYQTFKLRAEGVWQLMHDSKTRFVLVGGPSDSQVARAAEFADEMRNIDLSIDAIVVNRVPMFATKPLRVPELDAPAWATHLHREGERQRRAQAVVRSYQNIQVPQEIQLIFEQSEDVVGLKGLALLSKDLDL